VSSKTADAWCTADPLQACRLALHKKPFRAFHGLAKNPLFAVDTLIATAQDAARRTNDVYINVGNVSVAEKWEQIPVLTFPVAEVIRRVQTAEAWIVLKHVETDRRYKSILDEFTDFVKDIAGPEGEKFIRNPEMLVLITSPNRFTPYHFDAEINFLVQIHGSKDVWICDPLDRSITTEEEIERYYAVTITAGTYKPHAEERATRFTLHPGDAVHIPTHAAHWVKNHDEVSVSLSLNFEFPDSHQADVYRANHFLRRLGLNPRPPGNSITDLVKGSVVSLGRAAKRLVRR
jgi:hypothetical protein